MEIPEFALKRYQQLLGEQGAEELVKAMFEKELRKSIRVNTLKTTPQQLKKRLEEKGFKLEPIP